MTEKPTAQQPTPPAHVPQLQVIQGMTKGGNWLTILQFDYALNQDGKAVYPHSGPQVVEAMCDAVNQGRKALMVYGTSVSLDRFLSFRSVPVS